MADQLQHLDGRALAGRYYADVVAPLLRTHRPGLPHAAGRLGAGSDVLGLDDGMSRDHDWGLRLTVLVAVDLVDDVTDLLRRRLPETYAGYPTWITLSGRTTAAPGVDVDTPAGFARSRLGLDPRESMTAVDWLSLTGQVVQEVVAGPVFHDPDGELARLRSALAWYPDDVWWHVLACDWARLAEEMPLMSRAGDRGDDLGSRVIAGRLVDAAVHLGLTLERVWSPYPKWRGTVFARRPALRLAAQALAATLRAETWQDRQAHLAAALDVLLDVQRSHGLPAPASATTGFHDRPYLHADERVVNGLLALVSDPYLRHRTRGRGAVEQYVSDVALLTDPAARRAVAAIG